MFPDSAVKPVLYNSDDPLALDEIADLEKATNNIKAENLKAEQEYNDFEVNRVLESDDIDFIKKEFTKENSSKKQYRR